MKYLIFSFLFVSNLGFADTHVNGYYRKDGTYVQPYVRSTSDGNAYNNFSTKGNINPYTGKEGTVIPKNKVESESTTNSDIGE